MLLHRKVIKQSINFTYVSTQLPSLLSKCFDQVDLTKGCKPEKADYSWVDGFAGGIICRAVPFKM